MNFVSYRTSQLPAWLVAQLEPEAGAEVGAEDESAAAATRSPLLGPAAPRTRPERPLPALPAPPPPTPPSLDLRPTLLPHMSLLGTDAGPAPQGALRLAAALRAEHPGGGGGGGGGEVQALQARIEALVLGLVRDAAAGRAPSLLVPTHRWRALRRHAPRAAAGEGAGAGAEGGAERSAMSWGDARARPRLAALLLVVARAARLLREGTCITRRELFYAHAHDLRDQSAIDVAVLDAAAILEVPPWELRILPTSKGLIAGPIVLHMASGATIDCDVPGGALVPSDAHALVGARTAALFLLVVEKDAAFQRLLQEGVTRRVGPCVLLTGKGYPDTLVRVLLNRLWELLRLPTLLLMDADPHGIEIMATYRWGSKALAHESARLALPAARWLGVWPSEVAPLSLRSRPLAPRDAARLRSLAARAPLRACPAVLAEVECQMRIGVKAEIEDAATHGSAFLTDMYIPRKLASLDVI